MNQDLDQRVRADPRVRLILEAVEQEGKDGVRAYEGQDMDYALQHGLNQAAIDAAQTRYHEYHARNALEDVKIMGVDSVRDGPKSIHLDYGLQHGLYDQETIDREDTQYHRHMARMALSVVGQEGEDWVRKSHVFGDVLERGLAYGLKYDLFNQTDISGAQRRFETSHSLR